MAGQILESLQIGLEPILRLQVDVEADEVEKRQLQILGGWVVDITD